MRLALRIASVLLVLGLFVAAGGCAGKRYETWRSHDEMYASWSHAMFSIKNVCKKKTVTREDLRLSQEEGWWGEEVVATEVR